MAQSITFPAIPTQVALTSVGLAATASSGLAVTYTSTTPTICSVSGATASSLLAGTCTIQATQPGNTVYSAAPAVNKSFAVSHATQTITFPAIPTQVAASSVGLAATGPPPAWPSPTSPPRPPFARSLAQQPQRSSAATASSRPRRPATALMDRRPPSTSPSGSTMRPRPSPSRILARSPGCPA